MHASPNCGVDKQVYDHKTYAFSATYLDVALRLYTHFITAPTTVGGLPVYRMTCIDGWQMAGNIDTFLRGITAFINVRDLAEADWINII